MEVDSRDAGHSCLDLWWERMVICVHLDGTHAGLLDDVKTAQPFHTQHTKALHKSNEW